MRSVKRFPKWRKDIYYGNNERMSFSLKYLKPFKFKAVMMKYSRSYDMELRRVRDNPARIRRGFYKCECCKQEVPATKKVTLKNGKEKKVRNIVADHREPIVDPSVGFVDWNTWIERCFIELNGYDALCYDCHTIKSNKEKQIAKERKAK